MTGLLQVGLYHSNQVYIDHIDEMKDALAGSEYTLDEEQTRLNDGIAMIITKTEAEATRLMEETPDNRHGRWPLPSGCFMEVPTL